MSLDLIPVTFQHEYLDIMFFFKAINDIITVSNEVLTQPTTASRLTRSSVDTNVIMLRSRNCETQTYQRSFFIRVTRTYHSLPDLLRQKELSRLRFRALLLEYYRNAVKTNIYDMDGARTWKTFCLKCNASRKLMQPLTCCFQFMFTFSYNSLSLIY